MKNIFYLIILFIIALISCADPIEEISWDSNSIPAKLVVEGSITTDVDLHPIRLSLSDDYFSNTAATPVSNAEIILSDGTNQINYLESENNPGYYYANDSFAAGINKKYTLEINLASEVNDQTQYIAETNIIKGIDIDSLNAELYFNPNQTEDDDSLVVIVIAYGLEPADIENNYLVKFYRNGVMISDTVNDWTLFKDTDNESNGSSYFGFMLEYEFRGGDTLSIGIYSIEEDYYNFLEGVNQISEPEDPWGFSGPRANAIGNINNGEGLGYFFGAHKTSGATIVIDKTN